MMGWVMGCLCSGGFAIQPRLAVTVPYDRAKQWLGLPDPSNPVNRTRISVHGGPVPPIRQGMTQMATERTLSIIKPDATRRNLTGKINAKFEDAGLRIVAQKRLHLSTAQAGKFYEVHKDRPFYGELVDFMASEPVVVQVLEGENAIAKNREVMGATNPANADAGTIRKEFALSMGENSVHGSDAPETAAEEIAYFFSGLELVG
jgi:nucleoside-diphosphate kinase